MAKQEKTNNGFKFVYFGSGGSIKGLSNLYEAPITLTMQNLYASLKKRQPQLENWLNSHQGRLEFPSVEHLYQGLKAKDLSTFLRFTSEGDLSFWSAKFFGKTTSLKKRAKYAKKLGKPVKSLTAEEYEHLTQQDMAYWKTKNLIGIMPKLASNPSYGKALNLGVDKMDYASERLDALLEHDLWIDLENLKYIQNPPLALLLFETGNKTLVEFDKGATKHHSHWGGLVKNNAIVGDNVMGKYLMEIRAKLPLYRAEWTYKWLLFNC